MKTNPQRFAGRAGGQRAEEGFALLFVTVGIMGILFLCATAVDLGIGFLTRARINKAVDAAALIATKYTPQGTDAMNAAATALGQANLSTATFSTTVATDSSDVTVVRVEGHTPIKTFFGKVAGTDQVQVGSAAEVTRYPLDLTLVLDTSHSMVRSHSFAPMQRAAKVFVSLFDPARDQLGIVYFGTTAGEGYPIQKNFVSGANQAIDDLRDNIDTNMMAGIQLGHSQLLSAPPRGSGRGLRRVIMVLFTDGRPNAFTATLSGFSQPSCPGTPPASYLAAIASWSRNRIRAVAPPDPIGNQQRFLCFDTSGGGVSYTLTSTIRPPPVSPMPATLPNGDVTDGDHVDSYGTELALDEASSTRADHAHVFTVGLGDPTGVDPPDENLLRQIANEGGIANLAQPQGQEFFAPDNSQLQYIFEQVAARILTRVTL